jgi:hypothetical protein
VDRLKDVLAPGEIGTLMADQEFTWADGIEAVADRDIPFLLRLKSDRRAMPHWRHRRGFAEDASARPVHTQTLKKQLDDQNLLALAARGVDPGEAIDPYRRRWDIETLFAVLKSKGFGLEETGPTTPARHPNPARDCGLGPPMGLARLREGPGRGRSAAPLRSQILSEEPLPLRTGPVAGDPHQCVVYAGRAAPMHM